MIGAVVLVIAAVIVFPCVGWAMLLAFFRRPKVQPEFHEEVREDSKVLIGAIFNEPLSLGLLKWFGIKRIGIDDLWCRYTVDCLDTAERVMDCHPTLHDQHGNHSTNFPLPPNIYGLWYAVATMDQFCMLVNHNGTNRMIEPGTYRCTLFIDADCNVDLVSQEFVVGVDRDSSGWVGGWRRTRPSLAKRIRQRLGLAHHQT
jgi:hypothetical protein